MKILLATSFPTRNIQEIRTVCRAWDKLGIRLVSFNSENEAEIIGSLNISNLDVYSTSSHGEEEYGRPLVYIDTVFSTLCRKFSQSFDILGIVNADIYPTLFQSWESLFQHIEENEMHVFKRTNVSYMKDRAWPLESSAYEYGYDLFLWKANTKAHLSNGDLGFAFGVPWWDYWFPIQMWSCGVVPVSHSSNWIYHIAHDDNFSQDIWHVKGCSLRSRLNDLLADIPLLPSQIESIPEDLLEQCHYLVNCIDSAQFVHFRNQLEEKDEGCSVVTACMDRNENLLKVIDSWLQHDFVCEVVIVDWASEVPVSHTLSGIQDSRVKIYRYDEEISWCLTRAFNQGFNKAKFSTTLKLDSDIRLGENFFEEHVIDGNHFYAGNWRTATSDSQKRLNGSFLARTLDLQCVGCYNEFIETYGWDDCDLYSRLETFLQRRDLKYSHVDHINQESKTRLENQVTKLGLSPLRVAAEIETELEIRVNEFYSFLMPDWPNLRHVDSKNKKLLRSMAYHYAMAKQLAQSYAELGVGLSLSSIIRLPTSLVSKLFAARHSRAFWGTCTDERSFWKMFMQAPFSSSERIHLIKLPSKDLSKLGIDESYLNAFASDFLPSIRACNHEVELDAFAKDMIFDSFSLYEEENAVNLTEIRLKSVHKKITVAVVVYNCLEFLEQLFSDISRQSIFDESLFVFILPDSPGGEWPYVQKFCERHRDNTILITVPYDPGLYDCWNMVAQESRSLYFSNWNTDDRRSTFHLERLSNFLDEHDNIDVASSALYVSYEKNVDFEQAVSEGLYAWFSEVSEELYFQDFFQLAWWENDEEKKNVIVSQNKCHCMPVWRTELHRAYGYFNESYFGPSADWEFWLRCARGGARFYITSEILGVYYCNPKSYGRSTKAASGEKNILKEYLSVEIERQLLLDKSRLKCIPVFQ